MSLPSQPQAYGAGMAGVSFDPIEFIKRPQVILRIVSLVFSIIVFGCIWAGGWYDHKCQMNDSGACGYGVGIGVIAFLFCIGFLVIDALFDNMSSVQHRKYAVLADLGVSGFWAFLWFVGFCFMADMWRRSDKENPAAIAPKGHGKDNVQAAIAFSFFSIISWAGLAFFAFRRYREGTSDTLTTGYAGDQPQTQSSPYSSFPGSDASDPYQQPFSGQKSSDIPDYQPPTY